MQDNSLSLTPPKLRWSHPLSPFLPPAKSLTPPHRHTPFLLLLPPSHPSAGLVACSCIVLCWESARADGGVLDWPADSGFNRRPRVQGDVDEQFFSFCPLFKTSFFVFCQLWSGGGDQRAGGEAERAPQAILLSKVVLKWVGWLLWLMGWNYKFNWTKSRVMLC